MSQFSTVNHGRKELVVTARRRAVAGVATGLIAALAGLGVPLAGAAEAVSPAQTIKRAVKTRYAKPTHIRVKCHGRRCSVSFHQGNTICRDRSVVVARAHLRHMSPRCTELVATAPSGSDQREGQAPERPNQGGHQPLPPGDPGTPPPLPDDNTPPPPPSKAAQQRQYKTDISNWGAFMVPRGNQVGVKCPSVTNAGRVSWFITRVWYYNPNTRQWAPDSWGNWWYTQGSSYAAQYAWKMYQGSATCDMLQFSGGGSNGWSENVAEVWTLNYRGAYAFEEFVYDENGGYANAFVPEEGFGTIVLRWGI